MLIFLYSLERVSEFTRCMVKQKKIHLSKYVFHQTTYSKPCTSNKILFYALYVNLNLRYTLMYTYQNDSIIAFQRSHCYSYICAVFAPFSRSHMKYLLAAKLQKQIQGHVYLYTGIYFTYACKQGNAKNFTTKLVLIFTARDLLLWFFVFTRLYTLYMYACMVFFSTR